MNEELKNQLQNSVTLKKGVKGYQWDIKIYFDDKEQEQSTLDRLKNIDAELKKLFNE